MQLLPDDIAKQLPPALQPGGARRRRDPRRKILHPMDLLEVVRERVQPREASVLWNRRRSGTRVRLLRARRDGRDPRTRRPHHRARPPLEAASPQGVQLMATNDDQQLSLPLTAPRHEPAIADAGVAPTFPATIRDTTSLPVSVPSPSLRMPRTAIKDWPRADRPRDKLLDRGPSILSDAELLAVVLVNGAPGQTALDQARTLMGACEHDWHRLAQLGAGEVSALGGFGPAKAAQILAALEIAKRYGEREFVPGAPLRGSGDIYALSANVSPQRPASTSTPCSSTTSTANSKTCCSRSAHSPLPSCTLATRSRLSYVRPLPRWSSSTTTQVATPRPARRISRSPNACALSARSWASASSTTSWSAKEGM